jgi:hypothetical protein
MKSEQNGSCELQMPKMIMWQVLCTWICMKPYKFSMIHKLEPEDCPKWKNFCETLPRRSPDLTSCDFFLWDYTKEQVFVPPLPLDFDELKLRINAFIKTIDRNMLGSVWNELD